jgi:hypothetical protein
MIRPAQLDEVRSKLKPGDILIERQNWFLLAELADFPIGHPLEGNVHQSLGFAPV